jgi:hypothetical protein
VVILSNNPHRRRPGHRNPATLLMKAFDSQPLPVGQHLGDDLIDVQLASDGLRAGAAIARQHDQANSPGTWRMACGESRIQQRACPGCSLVRLLDVTPSSNGV